jgi:hypothetical protein
MDVTFVGFAAFGVVKWSTSLRRLVVWHAFREIWLYTCKKRVASNSINLWDVTACSLVEIGRRFGGTYCLLCLLFFSRDYFSILKTEAVRSFETSLIYGSRRHSVTESSRAVNHSQFCESFRATILIYWLNCGARDIVVGWGTMLEAGRSRVRFLMGSLDFFSLPNPAALWPWGWLSL